MNEDNIQEEVKQEQIQAAPMIYVSDSNNPEADVGSDELIINFLMDPNSQDQLAQDYSEVNTNKQQDIAVIKHLFSKTNKDGADLLDFKIPEFQIKQPRLTIDDVIHVYHMNVDESAEQKS